MAVVKIIILKMTVEKMTMPRIWGFVGKASSQSNEVGSS